MPNWRACSLSLDPTRLIGQLSNCEITTAVASASSGVREKARCGKIQRAAGKLMEFGEPKDLDLLVAVR